MSIRRVVWTMLLAAVLCAAGPGAARAQQGSPGGLPAPGTLRIGGRHKPSLTGATPLRALVVFVRFRGDTARTEAWPDPERLPDWAEHIVDGRASDIGRHPWNLSAYYRENSRGRFTLLGDVYYVTTDSSEEYYHRRVSTREQEIRGALVRRVLEQLDDERGPWRVDFRRYDAWSSPDEYRHEPRPDGQLDLLWLITRNYHGNAWPRGDARGAGYVDFARTSADFDVDPSPLRFDSVRINATPGFVAGSGCGINVIAPNLDKQITMVDSTGRANGRPTLIGEIAHEFSHYLFGTGHFGDGASSLSARRYTSYFQGLAAHAGNCFGHHCALEKIRLGWLDAGKGGGLRVVGDRERRVVVRLDDQARRTPGGCHAVKIPLGDGRQYLLLEARGWKGRFEPRVVPYNGARARLRPGVLATHVVSEADYFAATKARVLCADGKFRWTLTARSDERAYDASMDAMRPDSADRCNGYDERERIFIDGDNRHRLAGYWPNPPDKPAARGPYADCSNCYDRAQPAADNAGDAYDLFQPGDVVSITSNPAITLWNGKSFVLPSGDGICVYLRSVNEATGVYTVEIRRGGPGAFPPSRPTGLRRSDDSAACPLLVWSQNAEPDFQDGGRGRYALERSVDGGPFERAALCDAATRRHRQDCRDIPDGARELRFRLRACDARGRWSAASEPLRVLVNDGKSK